MRAWGCHLSNSIRYRVERPTVKAYPIEISYGWIMKRQPSVRQNWSRLMTIEAVPRACEASRVSSSNRVLLEVCVQSPADCLAAARGGADRVELCSAIELGGLTPSLGAITAACSASPLPVVVLTRPRAGDFIYSPTEVDLVTRDLERLREVGARGAALGALTPSGDIDQHALQAWAAVGEGLELVFHRAFDSCRAPLEALELLVECGVKRVLTSGGAPTAAEGAENLAAWIEVTSGRLEILPGGSIRADNVIDLLSMTSAEQVHFRAPSTAQTEGKAHPLGPLDAGTHEVTDADIVRAVQAAINGPLTS